MSGSLKNRLFRHEVTPPPGTWENISSQLDIEYHHQDAALSKKLETIAVPPPTAVWKNISSQLDSDKGKTKRNVIPLVYKRLAVAAVTISIISIFAIYLINSNSADKDAPVVNRSSVIPSPLSPSASAFQDSSTSTTSALRVSVTSNPRQPSKKRLVRTAALNDFGNYSDFDIDDLKPVQTISALEPIHIDAPPIRDESGNLIMDYSLITSPDEPYIIVTSPNGSQTKISAKFLDCLSYLNDNVSSSDINYEGQEWKSRFKEWRDKLSEAGFVPSVNNFFDIFELQELITD